MLGVSQVVTNAITVPPTENYELTKMSFAFMTTLHINPTKEQIIVFKKSCL